MNEDLLSTPTFTVRKCAVLVSCVSSLSLAFGAFLAIRGTISPAMFAWRVGEVGVLGGALVAVYAWLYRWSLRARPERLPWIHSLISSIGMMVFYGSLGLMLRDTPLGHSAPVFWWIVPFIFATTLIGGGVTRRVGESRHCPQCEYEYAYDDPEDAPARCPECGTPWLGRLKKGRRVRSVRMIVTGVILATVAAIVGNPVFYMGSLAPHLPTPMLCASVYLSPESSFGAWEELAGRAPSDAWIRRLGALALERRSRNSNDFGPGLWFEAMMTAGKVPKGLETEWYRAGWRAELDVPARANAGDAFTARIRVLHAAGGTRSCMGVMFGGYTIGDATSPLGRLNKTTWAYELAPGALDAHREVFAQAVTPERPGRLRVRATFWLVYQPSFTDELKWQPDGTPVRPSAALWFEKFELEEVVRVE